jgi:predicted TIM-barrel fold metal-dependent hydrolase
MIEEEQDMVDFANVKAIDFHTHAEEPCCTGRDDGYNEFQEGMAAYFRNPAGAEGMLPTVQQTAEYYRERNIAAVIFPVDAERETGFRRYSNEEVAGLCAENDDILIPFASVDPHKGKAGAREVRRLVRDFGVRGFKFHPTMQGFTPMTAKPVIRCSKPAPKKASSPSFTPAKPASAPACAAAWACA